MELKEKHLSIAESNNPVSEKMLDLISKKGLKQTYIAEKAGYLLMCDKEVIEV